MPSQVTPVGRVSFPAVYKPEAFEGDDDAKYSIVLLFDAKTDLSEMKKAAEVAAFAQFPKGLPEGFRSPFRSCDSSERYRDVCPGGTFVRFSTKTKPKVVGNPASFRVPGDPNPVLNEIKEDSGLFYAGCYGRVKYRVYGYDVRGNRGVAFGLEHVQKWDDGEPLGGVSAADAFADSVGEMPTDDLQGLF